MPRHLLALRHSVLALLGLEELERHPLELPERQPSLSDRLLRETTDLKRSMLNGNGY